MATCRVLSAPRTFFTSASRPVTCNRVVRDGVRQFIIRPVLSGFACKMIDGIFLEGALRLIFLLPASSASCLQHTTPRVVLGGRQGSGPVSTATSCFRLKVRDFWALLSVRHAVSRLPSAMSSSDGLMVYARCLRRVVMCTTTASSCGDIFVDGALRVDLDDSMTTRLLVSHSGADDLDTQRFPLRAVHNDLMQ